MRRTGVMLARPFDAKRLAKWPTPYILQPKINGRRAVAVFDGLGYCFLRSSEGHLIKSLPTLVKSMESLGLKNVTLDGELYVHGWTKQEIDRVVGRTATIHAREAEMQYHVFDLINGFPQHQREDMLYHLRFEQVKAGIIPVPRVEDEDIEPALEHWLAAGYEGIIIRHKDGLYQPCNEKARSDYLMKLKPRKTIQVEIWAKLEEESIYKEPKDTLGAFVCAMPDSQQHFKVGTGFTREQREDYWNRKGMQGQLIEILYQELSERGVPIFPVFKRLVEKEVM